jgi:DNA repair exonuclease SbcCD ATPase subunit
VWIEELGTRGFRCLRGSYRFDKGLTLVVGANEAGKSSLHEALIRALFGFSRSERSRRGGTSTREASTPWTEGPFELNALVHEARGRSFRIEWNFEDHQVTLLDARTGEDLSQEVRLKRDEVRLGQYLLGLTLDDFREVCCLDQATIDAVERTENLVLALQQSIESTARDHGVESAIAILNDRLRDAGVHVGTLASSPTGPLTNLTRELETLLGQIQHCDVARREIAARAAELGGCREHIAGIHTRVRAIDQEILRATVDRLQGLWDQVDHLQREAAAVPQGVAIIPAATVDQIHGTVAALRTVDDRIRELADRAKAASRTLESLAGTREERAREIATLPPANTVDVAAEPEVRRLLGQRERILEERDRIKIPSIQPPSPVLTRYRSERPKLRELQSGPSVFTWNFDRLIAALIIAVACTTFGVTVHPLWLAGLVLAGILAAAARVVKAPSGDALAAALTEFDVRSLDELEQRVREEENRIAGAEALARERRTQMEDADRSLERIDVELAKTLDAAGLPPSTSVVDRAHLFLNGARHQAERARQQARLESLDAEIAMARLPLEELERKRHEHERLKNELRDVYTSLKVDSSDLGDAAATLAKRVEEARAAESDRARARAASEALAALLRGETADSLSARLQAATRAYEAHVRENGIRDSSGIRVDSLAVERERLLGEAQALELKAAEHRTLIQSQESGLPDIPVLKEQHAAAQDRISRIERLRDAIGIARQALEEAARETHRKFAPYLNAALQKNLPRVTDGRYVDAIVDEDLQIRVQVPETGKFLPTNVLSRGTQDQIYLIQRLEIVRLLDPTTGEAPLLLDDALTRFDRKRLQLAFGLLAEVAAERQVVLFSEDEGMVDVAQALGIKCAVIRLPGPAARAATPSPATAL